MNTATAQNQKGFTLVEIAIVLVIIGLLLGGVLKGQELITNSKIKSTTQDLEGIAAAYYAYQDRTGRIPGDSTAAPGDGEADNNQQFWDDLRREGFISGASGTAAPRHALDGTFAISPFATGIFGGTKNFICATNIEERVAQGMDTKLDDGIATTGVFIAELGTTSPLTTAPTADYTQSDAATVVCKEL